jgi:uroporphyrinogen III methyltransferase / synthase
MKSSGIVYLVGAGPGSPDLITRAGYDLLQHCDAVAYDALIPMELIAELPDKVEKYYVGKRAGKHSLPQSQINDLLLRLARRGLRVVRLKGGDPFIFGRSGEEAEHLTAAGIPVVMTPGVTAASAVAAMSGFSLTNRQSASWIFLATGHGAESSSIPVPWEQIAGLPGGTLVIYMGLAKLDHLIAQILSSGLSPETPALAVQAASTGIQKSVEAPLAKLSGECAVRGLKPPALVVIGEAIRNKAACANSGALALAGKRILITSPSQLTSRFCSLFRREGAEPIPYPTVVRKPFSDSDGWTRFLETADRGGLCFFASELDIDCFFNGLDERGLDARSLNRLKIIAFSRSIQAALLRRGIKADQSLDAHSLANLAEAAEKFDSSSSLPLILVHGGIEDPQMESGLHLLQRELILLKVSMESTAVWESHWAPELIHDPPDCIVFGSTAEVDGFFELMGDGMAREAAGKARIAAFNEMVRDAIEKHQLPVHIHANFSSMEALVGALKTDLRLTTDD